MRPSSFRSRLAVGVLVDEGFQHCRDLAFRDPRVVLNYATSCVESDQSARAIELLEKLPPEANAAGHFEACCVWSVKGKKDEERTRSTRSGRSTRTAETTPAFWADAKPIS